MLNSAVRVSSISVTSFSYILLMLGLAADLKTTHPFSQRVFADGVF
jgi:hypothetical protein